MAWESDMIKRRPFVPVHANIARSVINACQLTDYPIQTRIMTDFQQLGDDDGPNLVAPPLFTSPW